MFEQALEWYRKIHRMEPFVFRYFNVCGADDAAASAASRRPT